jgi:16S rRNA (guanine(966)-N(2))-methyltransferase RsmD
LAFPGTLPDVDVLDLFAGCGTLGIEALSRGARACTFVEHAPQALRCLHRNLERLRLEPVSTVLADNAWTMRLPQRRDGFALIFVDPPYRAAQEMRRVVDMLGRIASSAAPGGLVVFRSPAGTAGLAGGALSALRVEDERVLGRMRLTVLVKPPKKTVAIIGASAQRSKFGNKAVRAYLRQGWEVYPVNPRGGQIEGLPAFQSVAEIPAKLDRVSLYLPPALGLRTLPEIAGVHPTEFFVNPGAESPELLREAQRLDLDPILACSIVAINESPDYFSE